MHTRRRLQLKVGHGTNLLAFNHHIARVYTQTHKGHFCFRCVIICRMAKHPLPQHCAYMGAQHAGTVVFAPRGSCDSARCFVCARQYPLTFSKCPVPHMHPACASTRRAQPTQRRILGLCSTARHAHPRRCKPCCENTQSPHLMGPQCCTDMCARGYASPPAKVHVRELNISTQDHGAADRAIHAK